MIIALIAALCCILSFSSAKEIDCFGALIKIDLINENSSNSIYGQPAFFGKRLTPDPVGPFNIIKNSFLGDACSDIPQAIIQNEAALVERGNCSFFQKALNLHTAGYKSMLLYDTTIDDICIFMHPGDNDTIADVDDMTIATITATAAQSLFNSLPTPEDDTTTTTTTAMISPSESIPTIRMLLSFPDRNSYFDPSEIILLLLAIFTITIGSLWAGHSMLTTATTSRRHYQRVDTDDDGAIITMRMAGTFVFVASGSLLFLFFFLNEWIAAMLIALFAFVAWQSTFFVLSSFFSFFSTNILVPRRSPIISSRQQSLRIHLPLLGTLTITDLLALSSSTLLIIIWLILRPTHLSYLPQDILCVCLMLFMLRSIHLPNLKIASVLLSSALIYDVWWVFIQPMVTGGPSVMVEVASGGGVGMKMPLLLAVPQLYGLGSNPALSMLGLGDVILPGLVVVLGHRWDVSISMTRNNSNNNSSMYSSRKKTYFVPLIVSYAIGLLITFIALALGVGGDQGQPALLYLVPCTLGTMLVLAWLRGDMYALWHGCVPIVEDDGGDGDQSDEERGLLS